MEDQAENSGMLANQAELGAILLSPLSTVILDTFLFYCISTGILICTLNNMSKDAFSGSAVLCASFFPSIFLTSAWIQLHKDVIALTVYSWDSPSKVGESPDQSKAKLALVNPMAFLSLFRLWLVLLHSYIFTWKL